MDLTKFSEEQLKQLQGALTPRTNKYIPITPTPRQTAALLMNIKEMLYGGAAGGGKSVFLLAAALQYVDCPGYDAILFRKTFSDLMLPGALIPMSKEWLLPYLDSGEVHWSEKEHRYTFRESGATLSFGYLENGGDHYRYQGAQFSFIGMDEVTHINPESYRYLFSRMRKTKDKNFPMRFRATCNPGGQYGEYYYNRFFVDNKDISGKIKRVFLQSTLKDNPYLDAEAYREALAELDPVTRAQLEDGNWEIRAVGDVFDVDWLIPIDREMLPSKMRTVRAWDIASIDPSKRKKGQYEGDFTGGIKMGYYQGNYYIMDAIATRKTPGEVEELFKSVALADTHQTAIAQELQPGAAGKFLEERIRKEVLPGYMLDFVSPSGSKVERARPLAAAMQAGNVFIVKDCRNLTEFYTELRAFPATGTHDDLVDACAMAFNHFAPSAGRCTAPVRKNLFTKRKKVSGVMGDITVSTGSYWHANMSNRR